jgi:hypothetical protein
LFLAILIGLIIRLYFQRNNLAAVTANASA